VPEVRQAAILRGGPKPHSARALHACLAQGLQTAGLAVDAFTGAVTDRRRSRYMLAG